MGGRWGHYGGRWGSPPLVTSTASATRFLPDSVFVSQPVTLDLLSKEFAEAEKALARDVFLALHYEDTGYCDAGKEIICPFISRGDIDG